ncbi:hypothetical protein ACROYT_G000344 [Oculina patagonica]
MAEELEGVDEGALVRPALEMELQVEEWVATIRINDRGFGLVGAFGAGVFAGIVLAEFYRRNPELVNAVITRAVAPLGRAFNFRGGSVVFDLLSQLSLESLTIEIKQRVEEAFQELGFFKELEVTVMNVQECKDNTEIEKGLSYLSYNQPPIKDISGVLRKMSGLPRPVRHFVNRVRELTEMKKYLSPDPQNDCRCVLVHGAIGMGKTTTAIKATNEMLDTNPNTVVVYVNCRYVASFVDLAERIGNQLHHFPFNESISEMKWRLINDEEFYTILFLDNFEFLLHLGDSWSAEKQSEMLMEESEIMKFITEIATKSRKVRLLVTSSENVDFPAASQERIRLLPFNEEDSFQLLKKVYGDTPVAKETAYKIAQFCGGIPLVLCTLASWQDHPSDCLEMLTKADQKDVFELLTRISTASENNKIKVCLDACFNRLDEHMQDTLVSLALFRGLFTLQRAVEVFQSPEIKTTITELARRSFLEQNVLDPTSPCQYSLLTVISHYCQKKALESRYRKVFCDARKLFIDYYLTFLEETFKTFFSTEVSKAIIAFRQEDENILQLIDWFAENGAMDEDQEKRCIDVFNDVGELLAKMMGKKKFDTIFTMLRKKCDKAKDQKRLSECLTSLGIKEVFSCCCSPGLCYKAAARAKTYLIEADRIQSSLGINNGNSRAQCLAKLGRCLVKEHNLIEGKDKIQQAIDIRKARGDEDIVMLGETYNDLAVALSVDQEHRLAIEVREQQTLSIYREKLGNHFFTATILNNLSNNYYALGEYDNAKECSEEALKIRRELLRDHYDTAKSLFDLGMVHRKKKEEFREAKLYLEDCASMQKVLQNDDIMDFERTTKELEDIVRNLLAITL